MTDPTYPLFVAKVPKGMGVVKESPADLIFLRFDDIFNMFHLKRFHPTLVCLVALSMAYQVKEKTPGITIMDPYYMLESNMRIPLDRIIVTKYIEDFFMANKQKKILLLPYFPE